MVAYEYMAAVLAVFSVEAVWEVRLIWPHACGEGLGKFRRPVVLTLLSTVIGLVHVILELLADFPKNRVLGETGVPPIVYNSTASNTMVIAPAFQGHCVAGIPLFDLSIVVAYGFETPLFEFAAAGFLYTLVVEQLAAGKRETTYDSLRRLKRANTWKVVLITAAIMMFNIVGFAFAGTYFLCEKRLNMNFDLMGYALTPEDYPFTSEERDRHSLGQLLYFGVLAANNLRFVIWIMLFRLIRKLNNLIPSDSDTSNVVSNTRAVVRVAWVPLLSEVVGWTCAVAALVAQQFLDRDEDQIYVLLHGSAELAALLEDGGQGKDASEAAKELLRKGLAECNGVLLSQIGPDAFVPGDTSAEFSGAVEATSAGPEIIQCQSPDFFVSHSWRDSPQEKYEALRQVCTAFKVQHGREPILWIDKYCIDQKRIQQALRYLPVFVNAAKQRLVLHGPSYFSRLWCMWELYVMTVSDPKLDNVLFWSVQGHGTTRLGSELGDFDVQDVSCYRPEDKGKILATIDSQRGGMQAFNSTIRDVPLSMSLLQRSAMWRRVSGRQSKVPSITLGHSSDTLEV
ncbi:unnamed protein product [Prorocentrum cordatum]|uniref:Heterokaryon incompatibility domain-containing protein n=1 Tax=Prorocentrum cordatum TaxID=2364126 RepID=A0ABN9S8P8_9DINO|nr:unnamed protein product [Polarella glacialis]